MNKNDCLVGSLQVLGLGGGRVAVVGNVAGRYWNRIGRVDSSGSALLILITCFLSFPRMSPSVML